MNHTYDDVEMDDDPGSGSTVPNRRSRASSSVPTVFPATPTNHTASDDQTPDPSLSHRPPATIRLSSVQLFSPPESFDFLPGGRVIVRDFATNGGPRSSAPSNSDRIQSLSRGHSHGSRATMPNDRPSYQLDTPPSNGDTERFSQTPELPSNLHHAAEHHFPRSESPTPPSSRDKGKAKAPVEVINIDSDDEDPATSSRHIDLGESVQEKEESSIPPRRRRPRPRPIFGDNDPNLLFTGHMANPPTITPTSTTGFAGLTLDDINKGMTRDMTDEMSGLPANVGDAVRQYVHSQLRGVPRYTTPAPGPATRPINTPELRRNTTPANGVEVVVNINFPELKNQRTAPQQTQASGSAIRRKIEPGRPSKKVKNDTYVTVNGRKIKIEAKEDQVKIPLSQIPQPDQELYPGLVLPSIETPLPRPAVNPRKRKYTPFHDLSYRRTNNPNFNVFSDGILRTPDLLFYFVSSLPVKTCLSLYAMSKDFHNAINQRFVTMILSTAFIKAPESAQIFTFRGYGPLATIDPRYKDPSQRIPHPNPEKAALGIPRLVPGFKWLQMIMYREKVVHEILAIMAEDGIPIPPKTSVVLKHIWFSMDFPGTGQRIGYFHNRKKVTDLDIFYGTMFVIRLDMRFTVPTAGHTANMGGYLRRLVMGQRSLSYLWKVLKGLKLRTQFEALKEWVRFKYRPSDPADRHHSVFGIPPWELGRGCLVNWGGPVFNKEGIRLRSTQEDRKFILIRPDQILLRECIKRQLNMSRWHLKMMLWGYVDMAKLRKHQFDPEETILAEEEPMNFDCEPRVWQRRITGLEDEYSDTEELGAPEIPSNPEDRDSLLDLGPVKRKSKMVLQPDRRALEADERENRAIDDMFLDRMMAVCEAHSRHVNKKRKSRTRPTPASLPAVTEEYANHDSLFAPSSSPPPSPSFSSSEESSLLDPEKSWDILRDMPEIWIDASNDSELWVHQTRYIDEQRRLQEDELRRREAEQRALWEEAQRLGAEERRITHEFMMAQQYEQEDQEMGGDEGSAGVEPEAEDAPNGTTSWCG